MKVKASPFLTHVFSTASVSLATAVSQVFLLRFLAQGLGGESFGLYSLSNRAFTTLAPFTGLMMGLAMSRNLSCSVNPEERNQSILAASLWVCLAVALMWISGLFFWDNLSAFFLGSSGHGLLWFATLSSVSFFAFYALLDGIYFGSLKIFRANLWQWALGVAGPLAIAFHYRNAPVHQIVFLFGGLYAVSLIPLILIWREIWRTKKNEWSLIQSMKRLIAFSAPRMLGRWLFIALLLTGPLFAAHFISYEEAGFLVLAQAVFRVAEMGTNAFASVALSKTGALMGEGRHEFVRERVKDLLEMIFQIGFYLTVHLFLWSDDLVTLWLGSDYLAVSLRMKILTLGILPYFAYVVLRPIIDAMEFKAIGTRHLAIACAVVLFLTFPLARLAGGPGLALAAALGFLTLGGLTIFYFGKRDIGRALARCLPILGINAALAATAFGIQSWFHRSGSPQFLSVIAIELLLGALYLYSLWSLKSRWLLEIEKRLLRQTPSEVSQGIFP